MSVNGNPLTAFQYDPQVVVSLGLGTLLATTTSYYYHYTASTLSNSSVNEKLRLWDFGVPSSGVPSTYLQQSKSTYTIAESQIRGNIRPDTTAVVLNWSRLNNVILIAELLCGPWLENTIAQVFIWNNNPNFTLTVEDFRGTGCSGEKLHIHNSQSNMHFVARYIACAEAQTPFCFVQDDDYLVRPEIIRNMHKAISQSSTIQSLHLLPAHEHLLSCLRTVTTIDNYITTTFTWLGYGTYLKRSSVKDFLRLLHDLKLTDEETKMADNYFTIFSNRQKRDEVWFDHGIELGGGQPFTMGAEGDARNDRHMTQALSYLSSSVSDRGGIAANNPYISPAYISQSRDGQQKEIQAAEDMVSEAQKRWLALGEERRQWYIQNPLSAMVDGRSETAFHSREEAQIGDWIAMDAMEILDLNERELELSFLVNAETEQLFRDCTFSTSTDGNGWISGYLFMAQADMLHRLSSGVRAPAAMFRRNVSIKNIVYGSPEAKLDGEVEIQQHSRIVARGKYLHVFEFHKVKPGASEDYKKAAESYYTGIKSDPQLNVKLTGSWETIVGDNDTFVHITEYENHGGFDRSFRLIQDSDHIKSFNGMLPFLTSRTTQINQEFAFFPSSPPRSQGGIFELRSYQLTPGSLLEWESAWRIGIEARRKLIAPVGAWFSQIGRLHQVHHLWQYPDFETRSEIRERAWQVDGWSDTVHKTTQLAKFMDSTILVPLPFSPLK
ncbi:hypothetical protein M0805_003765 [Coniferiporia weirii]|nr:hypothetical protein M0805_003765 [Coniferiporia weirii]